MYSKSHHIKYFLSLSILLFCTFQSIAQVCQTGNCTNGTGIMIFASGGKYIGHFKDGKANGIGKFIYSDGSIYQGNWVNNYPDGQGVKIYPDGSRTEGWWSKGKPTDPPQSEEPAEAVAVASKEEEVQAEVMDAIIKEEKKLSLQERLSNPNNKPQQTGCISGDCTNGKGIYIYPSGAAYIGEFKDGLIHGIGVCYYPNGSKYQGNWVKRYPEGRGTKISADGRKWTGQWKKGQPLDNDGQVIAELFPNESNNELEANVQTGCVSGNCTSGIGIFAYANGARFEGSFKNGKPNGRGAFYYPDESTYIGDVQNGLYHGDGEYTGSDGHTLSGMWEEGTLVEDQNVVSNVGCIEGDCSNGYGTLVKPNGDQYVGNFKNGVYHGHGTLIGADGSEIKGNWYQGIFEASKTSEMPTRKPKRGFKRPKVYAVVVGVSSYDHMPTLKYTDDDAYRVYAFLRSPKGGALEGDQISVLIDEAATKVKIIEAMRSTFAKAGPEDLIMLYFSGHGLNGAFLPIDFDGYNNRLDHETIKSILEESQAKYKICIADACHSGSLLAMKGGTDQTIIESYYDQLAQAKAGTALIMSSKSQETSLESQGLRQGVFSHYLIKGLEGEADIQPRDRIVTIAELFEFINANVKAYTGKRQTPVIQGDFDPNMPVSVLGM